nr:hypothetical protein [Streptomyces sp. B3I8]
MLSRIVVGSLAIVPQPFAKVHDLDVERFLIVEQKQRRRGTAVLGGVRGELADDENGGVPLVLRESPPPEDVVGEVAEGARGRPS